MQIKNLKKAAKRIKKAIKDKENIILYGDSDMDGMSSVIILKETIENLNGEVKRVYFPNREEDGYGLNKKALLELKKEAPGLLITLDCGIGNFQEVKEAQKSGFEVIIIDHHEILGEIPEAEIVVDPKQPGDKYPFKHLANVGIIFYLSQIMLKNIMNGALRQNFLELTTMATIADMMPRIEDNQRFIEEGALLLRNSWRPGIQALFSVSVREMDLLEEENKGKRTMGFNYLPIVQQIEKMNSLLNLPDFYKGLPLAFQLLTSHDYNEAEKIAKKLFQLTIEKKEKINQIIHFLEKKAENQKDSSIIFEGKSDWRLIFLGTAASVLAREFNKPVFLYKKGKKESPGSARAPEGYNLVSAMKACSHLLITFGGHPPAAGFRLKNDNLERFKNCLEKYFKLI